jgi:hypothetical protein
MMPEHCRHVSIRKVNFELKVENIRSKLMGTKIYKGTDYLILNNDEKYCIVRIGKTPRRSLFWEVTSVEPVSDVENTIFMNDAEVDVLNKNSMGSLLSKFPGKTIAVQGKFGHVSFLTPEDVLELTVLEVTPPEPPKVIALTKEMLKFKSFSKPIILKVKIIDIYEMLNNKNNHTILLPCHATRSEDDSDIKYLDEFPKLNHEKKDEITLAGCDLSLRIFKDVYNFEPNFINTCPAKLAEGLAVEGPVLVKCCAAKKPERKGNLYMVPWGATYDDIEKILNEFIKQTG